MSKLRLFLALMVVVGLLPTWIRAVPAEPDWRPILRVTPINLASPQAGPMQIEGAWELDSSNAHFGSYSALVVPQSGKLLAASDAGRILRFSQPGQAETVPFFNRITGDRFTRKSMIDAEAMTRDPDTGQIWIAYEGTNVIERRDADLGNAKRIAPPSLARFGTNSGPEAFTRLADGRFVVLSEGPRETFGDIHTGIIFDRDPLEGGTGERFAFKAPDGYRPVDMVQIPDGRVLILMRRLALGLPPTFPVQFVIADPTEIAAGNEWSGTSIAKIAKPLPSDNFEGLAYEEQSDGVLTLWLISDDNNATLQRTLLLKLRWDPAATD